jgi:hypothetical protein
MPQTGITTAKRFTPNMPIRRPRTSTIPVQWASAV